jgi:hypothetical protein
MNPARSSDTDTDTPPASPTTSQHGERINYVTTQRIRDTARRYFLQQADTLEAIVDGTAPSSEATRARAARLLAQLNDAKARGPGDSLWPSEE